MICLYVSLPNQVTSSRLPAKRGSVTTCVTIPSNNKPRLDSFNQGLCFIRGSRFLKGNKPPPKKRLDLCINQGFCFIRGSRFVKGNKPPRKKRKILEKRLPCSLLGGPRNGDPSPRPRNPASQQTGLYSKFTISRRSSGASLQLRFGGVYVFAPTRLELSWKNRTPLRLMTPPMQGPGASNEEPGPLRGP